MQVLFGWYHHHRFVKDRPTSRRWFTHTHLWLGRFIIIFGIINCGCGLRLALVSWTWVIVWWVITGALAGTYLILSFVAMSRKSDANRKSAVFSPERYQVAERYEMSPGSYGYNADRI